MRLERLEINGFKSFSDRSELAFDKGVTAIVGPNGCGKSNVADAITWVMGEQSAKSLRGERMEDVIFSGSDARRPTAAAEVRLRFSGVLKRLADPGDARLDAANGNGHLNGNGNGNGNGHGHANGDGNGHGTSLGVSGSVPEQPADDDVIQSVAREVEVTRRLYRSGESEYLIDGQVCRLRDIHDLLMDTGLGAKAYAIIEQGKIGMILSSRPTDRRQLIEEAAGITKYRARRRAAELKLEAARHNLTRIDDIVFEVEKQRGTLKRQAGKARRYQHLRAELRSWERILFAQKYRQLAATIDSARARLADARQREAAAAARVAEVESTLERLRVEHLESEAGANRLRETAHAQELEINRLQQHVAFEKEQTKSLGERTQGLAAEVDALDRRREPARSALAARRLAAAEAVGERDKAAAMLASEADAYEGLRREIEGLDGDVEAARSEVFSAINAATALRHALEHSAAARDRVADTLSRLQVEADDLRIESDRVDADRAAAADGLRRAHEAMDATRAARGARESELASARIEHEWRARSVRAREHEVAALEARLTSLRQLEAARAGYGDAARAVLAQANGRVNQRGAVADYLDVDPGYERAVEACLGDLLEHVVVEHPEHAAAGLQLVREQKAGRCGFLIASARAEAQGETAPPEDGRRPLDGLVALSSVVRANGPFAGVIRASIGDAWIAADYDEASEASRLAGRPVATMAGDVFRAAHLVSGGGGDEARGILETRREVREIGEQIERDRSELARLAEETSTFETAIAQCSGTIVALNADIHKQEKAIVALDAQLARAAEDAARVEQKREQLARERRHAEEERDAIDRRQAEARESIERLGQAQRLAEDRLTHAQQQLLEAREATEDRGRRTADAGASHAALIERAAALVAEVDRLEEVCAELEARRSTLAGEGGEIEARLQALRAAIAAGEAQLDTSARALEELRAGLQQADERVSTLRAVIEGREAELKSARQALEDVRASVAGLDIARATAETNLSHLAAACVENVQATLDDVLIEVDALAQAGGPAPPIVDPAPADEGDESADEQAGGQADGPLDAARGPEEAIAALRAKIDRLGPVNMMAIEQFDELESRHSFLTTQRKDLVDSIAQTSEAIKRIDETTRQRFGEAFAAINENFRAMFGTLFGGGRAGLALIDENDPLESGIEIIAQPPGKRLQSVQLLSGGEKALTAISLMFALFKYKPSPFCLLDEIDAPLDDANIGRFVEMLRGMQSQTQFILITHNRKTMEIADRLYGVTMEEPGVSKLISVQLN
jgi:chromosome segregation protein